MLQQLAVRLRLIAKNVRRCHAIDFPKWGNRANLFPFQIWMIGSRGFRRIPYLLGLEPGFDPTASLVLFGLANGILSFAVAYRPFGLFQVAVVIDEKDPFLTSLPVADNAAVTIGEQLEAAVASSVRIAFHISWMKLAIRWNITKYDADAVARSAQTAA
jgi:hypothetical protein